jgi:hypothetical protein
MVDLSKPYKRGGDTYHGYAKPSDPMFSTGQIVSGMTISELLGGSPKKATVDDKVSGPKGKAKGKR